MSTYQDPGVARRYDAHFRRRVDRAEDATIDRLLGSLMGRDVLDLGCGTAALLDRHVPRLYLGVDASPNMLKHACAKHGGRVRAWHRTHRWQLAAGDACTMPEDTWTVLNGPPTLPWETRRFDVAVSLFAFSYFQHPASALATAHRLLHPGGRLFLQAYTERYARRRHCLDREPDIRYYTQSDLCRMVTKAGFLPRRVFGVGHLPDWLANLLPVQLGTAVALQLARRLSPDLAMSVIVEAER